MQGGFEGWRNVHIEGSKAQLRMDSMGRMNKKLVGELTEEFQAFKLQDGTAPASFGFQAAFFIHFGFEINY